MTQGSRVRAMQKAKGEKAELTRLKRAAGPITRLIEEGNLKVGHAKSLHEMFIGRLNNRKIGSRALFTRDSVGPSPMPIWHRGAISNALKLQLTIANLKHDILVPAEESAPANAMILGGKRSTQVNLRGFQLTPAARDSLIAWGKLRGLEAQKMQPERVGLSPGMQKFFSRVGKVGKLVVRGIVKGYQVARPMSSSAIKEAYKRRKK